MISRRKFIQSAGLAVLVPATSLLAQQPRTRRIGFLAARSRSTAANPDVYYDAFLDGLRKLGYIEGKNLAIEWRFADGKYERLPGLATELVNLKVEVIATHSTAAAHAARRATVANPIPVVFAAASDPVGSGIVPNLARPGGNITGLSDLASELSPKRLELVSSMVPKLTRIAILLNPGNRAHAEVLKSVQQAALGSAISVLPVQASTAEEIESAFATIVKERAGAVIVTADGFFIGQGKQIAQLALKNKLPSVFPFREAVHAGGLMSYGQDLRELYRRAAAYVVMIFDGAKPGELPIEQPIKIHLALNRGTATLLGLGIPPDLQLRTDELIE